MKVTSWAYGIPTAVLIALAAASLEGGVHPTPDLWVLLLAIAGLFGLAFQLHRSQASDRRHRGAARAVSAYASGPVCLVDAAGCVTSINAAAAQLLGIEERNAVGQPAGEVIRVEGEGDPEWLQGALGGEVRRGRGRLVTAGQEVPVTYTAAPIPTDDAVGGAVLLLSVDDDQGELEERHNAERQYRTLIEISPDGMILSDVYGFIELANPRAASLHGYDDPADLIGKRMVELVGPEARVTVSGWMRRAVEDGKTVTCDYVALRRDDQTFPAEAGISRVSEGNETTGLLLVVRDISRHHEAQSALRVNRERAGLQQMVSDTLATASSLSEALPPLLDALAASGRWDAALFWERDARDDQLRPNISRARAEGGFDQYFEAARSMIVRPDSGLLGDTTLRGQPLWIGDVSRDERFPLPGAAGQAGIRTVLYFPLRSSGETQGIIEFISRDPRVYDPRCIETIDTVSAAIGQFVRRKQAERELEYRALHDALTDLPNRALFNARLGRALSVAATSGRSLAVLLMDMDRFKEVNDTFGHLHGDSLLKQAAIRLSASVRESDTVARLGGDEFAVLLPSIDRDGALAVAQKMLHCVEQPFPIDRQLIDIGISIGIAMYPDDGNDATTLVQHADVAMYQAKREQSGVAHYSAESDDHTPWRFALQSDLRRGIEHGELFLVYQPKIDVRTGEVNAVEALVRWRHPTRGTVPPDDFIPLAERTGLIRQLTARVLRDALRQLAQWQDAGFDLRVAINLSAQNLHDPDLVATVRQLLGERGIDPARLVLEITESAIMVNADRARETLVGLNDLGVRISIDDFGTGYSSLAYLHNLPTQEIKIDKSFVLDMLNEGDGAFIARSVIELGHSFGLQVVAEGVEDAETYEMLDTMRCDQVQGYYFSPPLLSGELTRWLNERAAPELPRSNIIRLGTG